jgi:hypothetical protein
LIAKTKGESEESSVLEELRVLIFFFVHVEITVLEVRRGAVKKPGFLFLWNSRGRLGHTLGRGDTLGKAKWSRLKE